MSTLRVAGGRVLRPNMSVDRADVLIDTDAGEILAVGTPGGGDEVLSADGGLVIPGLVNAHTHVAMTLLRGYADDKPLDRWLEEDIWPAEAELTAEDVRAGAELGILEMIRSGTTAFTDMYFHEPAVAAAVEAGGVRALLGHGIITAGKGESGAHEEFEEALAVAEDLQGAAEGRVQTALMPHSLTTVGAEYLAEYVPRARDLEVPVHYHANETTEEVEPFVAEQDRRPLTHAAELGMLEPGDFLAHCVHLATEEIALLGEHGAAVVHCPASNMKLASGMAAVQDLLDGGVTVALGTDGAASNNDLDMFDEMCDAAMVGKLAADDASAVSAPAVLEMATGAGARVLGLDGGRIAPGAVADLAVVDLQAAHLIPPHNLVSHLVYAASGADVRHTICDGRVLMRDREVLTLDAPSVRTEAAERARGLLSRAAD